MPQKRSRGQSKPDPKPLSKDVSKMTVPHLRKELKDRGLGCFGSRSELEERLQRSVDGLSDDEEEPAPAKPSPVAKKPKPSPQRTKPTARTQPKATVFASRAELDPARTRQVTSLFQLIDSNQNGTLELSELRAVFGGEAPQVMAQWDANMDGVLTEDEFVEGVLEFGTGMTDAEFQSKYLAKMAACVADTQFNQLSIHALRRETRDRGLNCSGTRDELVVRLREAVGAPKAKAAPKAAPRAAPKASPRAKQQPAKRASGGLLRSVSREAPVQRAPVEIKVSAAPKVLEGDIPEHLVEDAWIAKTEWAGLEARLTGSKPDLAAVGQMGQLYGNVGKLLSQLDQVHLTGLPAGGNKQLCIRIRKSLVNDCQQLMDSMDKAKKHVQKRKKVEQEAMQQQQDGYNECWGLVMMSMHQKLEEWNDIRDDLDDAENVMKAEFLGRQMNFALEELRGVEDSVWEKFCKEVTDEEIEALCLGVKDGVKDLDDFLRQCEQVPFDVEAAVQTAKEQNESKGNSCVIA